MKLFLKQGKLYVKESLGPLHKKNDSIIFEPEVNGDTYNYSYSTNGKEYKLIENGKFPLDIDVEDCAEIVFRIKQVNKSTLETKVYETHPIPCCTYLYLGKGIETMYPKVIEELLNEVGKLKKRVENLESEGDII